MVRDIAFHAWFNTPLGDLQLGGGGWPTLGKFERLEVLTVDDPVLLAFIEAWRRETEEAQLGECLPELLMPLCGTLQELAFWKLDAGPELRSAMDR